MPYATNGKMLLTTETTENTEAKYWLQAFLSLCPFTRQMKMGAACSAPTTDFLCVMLFDFLCVTLFLRASVLSSCPALRLRVLAPLRYAFCFSLRCSVSLCLCVKLLPFFLLPFASLRLCVDSFSLPLSFAELLCLNHAIITTIQRNLRPGRARKGFTCHRADHPRHIPRRNFGVQQIFCLILLDR
jgi:hypothetical protein